MQQKIKSLQEALDKKVSVDWREEVRKDTFVDHHHTGTLVQTSTFGYQVQVHGKQVFRFSYNDFVRGIIHITMEK